MQQVRVRGVGSEIPVDAFIGHTAKLRAVRMFDWHEVFDRESQDCRHASKKFLVDRAAVSFSGCGLNINVRLALPATITS